MSKGDMGHLHCYQTVATNISLLKCGICLKLYQIRSSFLYRSLFKKHLMTQLYSDNNRCILSVYYD